MSALVVRRVARIPVLLLHAAIPNAPGMKAVMMETQMPMMVALRSVQLRVDTIALVEDRRPQILV